MRIAIVGTRGIPARYGGFETSVEETAVRFVEEGHQVFVYCRGEKKVEKYKSVNLICFKGWPGSPADTIIHSIKSVFHIVFKLKDVDVVHFYNSASSISAIILYPFCRNFVITTDGIEWKRDKWGRLSRLIWIFVTWLSFKICSKPVCDSMHVLEIFEKKYDCKIKYIPYGANYIQASDSSFASYGLKENNYLLFVGRLVKEKGVELLIKGYLSANIQIPLVIVGGNDDDPAYVQHLEDISSDSVIFLGARYGSEYENLLSNAKIYISASKLEGTSPSLLSAMGSGICCLVNDIPENRETGSESILYHDGTVKGLSIRLRELSFDDDEIIKYGNLALQRIKENYDWNYVAKEYLSLYENL